MRHETGDMSETSDARPQALTSHVNPASRVSRLTSCSLASHVSRLTSSQALRFTLKSWPVIAAATIGLCVLTQQAAKLFGIDLPDQQNVELVRSWLTRAFESPKAFSVAASLVAQVVLLMPAIEECVFRWLLFHFPGKMVGRALRARRGEAGVLALPLAAAGSSTLFSAAHYIAQPWPDAAFFALFFFGLAQCWLYNKTQRLWCAMLNHVLFNLTNIVLLFIVPLP